MPATSELVASGRNQKEIERELGADWLIYQDLPDLINACRGGKADIKQFDTSCFSGKYVTELEDGYLEQLQAARSDGVRAKRRDMETAQSGIV